MQRHHVGGKGHIAWFTIPHCERHHKRVTRFVDLAGVNLHYTPDKRERLRRARKATTAFLWLLEDWEEEIIHG